MNPLTTRLERIYQKNQHLIDSLLLRKAPAFVYQSNPSVIEHHIPVFTFHVAIPEWFEEHV